LTRRNSVAIALPLPLSVAHGGREIQALRSMEALRTLGIDIQALDLWDREQTYGVLHCFGTDGGLWELASRARAAGVKIIVTPVLVFGRSVSAFRAWARVDRLVPMRTSFRYRRDLLRLADAVIALTMTERRILETIYGVRSSRCHVIPNGVDAAFSQVEPGRHRNSWGDEPFVLCVGSIEARKGQIEVLRAGRRAGKRVVFIGEVRRDDPYGANFARELRLADDAVWRQRLEAGSEALAGAYATADAMVLPSRAEGMPLAALEARAAGCPLIISDLPQHIEAFPGATFVRVGDEATLARAIATASRQTVPTKLPPPWSWDQVAAEIRRVYHGVAPEIVAAP